MSNINNFKLEVCKIAFEQSEKGILSQQGALTSIRQNTTVIVASSGIIATLFGKGIFKKSETSELGVNVFFELGALLFLFVTLYCAFQILKPREGWLFYNSPRKLVDTFLIDKATVDTLENVYLSLCASNEYNYKQNGKLLSEIQHWMLVSFALLFGQLMFWIFSLI